MTPMSIPAWNAEGVLPPIAVTDPGSPLRSPYIVSLSEVVVRFGMTADRRALLEGLLGYRSALHAAGLNQGFQWLDGSFLEDIELLEARSPNDIDVVTFYQLPPGETQQSLAQRSPGPFDHTMVKQHFQVDAYSVSLEVPSGRLIRSATYWYSMWSHRRNDTWKGFLQVDLAPLEDVAARTLLASAGAAGAQP